MGKVKDRFLSPLNYRFLEGVRMFVIFLRDLRRPEIQCGGGAAGVYGNEGCFREGHGFNLEGLETLSQAELRIRRKTFMLL